MNQFDNIPEELADKAKNCKNPEEILALVQEAGFELSDDELQSVSGGASWSCISDCPDHIPCPQDR